MVLLFLNIFEYSWFGLLLWKTACFKGCGLWDPVESKLKYNVSTLAAGLTDTELALLPLAMPSPTQTLSGAHHSALNTPKTKRVAPNPVIYLTTFVVPGMWFADLWWLSKLQETWLACRTWKVKKENLLTPKGGATMVLYSGKS